MKLSLVAKLTRVFGAIDSDPVLPYSASRHCSTESSQIHYQNVLGKCTERTIYTRRL